jgi:DNA-binding MarR family transcriptional regulator
MIRNGDVLYRHIEKLVHYLGYLETLRSQCCSLSIVQSASILAIGKVQDITVNGLAEELRLDKSSASKHVTNLVESGYVKRTESQEDRRYFVLSLTDKGQEAYQTIQDVSQQFYETIFDKMAPEDKDSLQQGLNAMLKVIRESDCC